MESVKINRDEAVSLLHEWADWLEVDTTREFFKDVVEELSLVVMNGKLSFDEDKETFRYKLLKPIVKQDDSGTIEILEIKETSLNQNKAIQKYKQNESIDQATALLAESCGINIGFASRIKQRDISKINAVILGFFVQAGGSKR